VVSLSGVSDMTANGLKYGMPSSTAIATILGYLGCTTVQAGSCEVAAEASPITHVDATDPPMILLNSDDEIVPVGQANAMQAALTAAGVVNQLIVEPGTKHGLQLNTTDNRAAVLAFLTEHL
jgi:acetyl esterase/lipase